MPELTVVVPALATSDHLGRCLDALAAQTLSPDRFEVLVTFAGDTDEARATVAARVAVQLDGVGSGPQVVLVECDGTTRAQARNAGVARARGSWTTFVGEHDLIDPDYLELLLDSASGERIAAARLVDLAADGSRPRGRRWSRSSRAVVTSRTTGGGVALAGALGAKLYPTSWLLETPFAPDLHHDEDAVLTAQLLGSFERQFAGYDETPARRGATYYRSPPASDPRDDGSRRAVVTALRAAQPTDLVEALVREQVVTTRSPWAALTTPPPRDRPLVVVATEARAVNEHVGALELLVTAGYAVRVLHLHGRLAQPLRSGPTAHRLTVLPDDLPAVGGAATAATRVLLRGDARRAARAGQVAGRLTREGLRVAGRVAPRVLPGRAAAHAVGVTDPTSMALLARPHELFVLDAGGRHLAEGLLDAPLPATTGGAAELASLALEVAAGRSGFTRAQALGLRRASTTLRGARAAGGEPAPAARWTAAAYRLVRAGRREAATQLLQDCRASTGAVAAAAAGHDALLALLRLDTTEVADTLETRGVRGLVESAVEPAVASDVTAAAGACLAHGDDALSAGDLERVTFLTSVALDLLFARVLHTATEHTALVSDPSSLLAPLRSSAIGALLSPEAHTRTERQGRTARTERTVTGAARRPRVTVVPGAYPKFARAVVEQLEGPADVRLLDLGAAQPRYRNTAVDPVSVRDRIVAAHASSHANIPAVTASPAVTEALEADVVFVDWADKGLSLVTEQVPDDVRVVVRLHGVDTLSAWLHTARWERVDDAIFPSEHLRLATGRALGGRLQGVRQHVVANPVEVDRYLLPKEPGAAHTLGMVGWGQQVKDPEWTLDLLERLRASDQRWRLLLIGADFPLKSANRVENAAARRFRSRLLAGGTGLASAVEFVGYTSRLPEVLRRVGWGVSSSRREGFHIGLVEMAASGAVPVVRDWPVYAELGGARRLFPSDWVVADVDEAAERVLTLSDDGNWAERGSAAAKETAARFTVEQAGEQLRRIVLG
ncbi:MAG: hypothetical protein JWP82_2337 [Humibacillus sp.]|nr:hypothetical protein [Humibacillus sp.]